jgi:hypothetical protein
MKMVIRDKGTRAFLTQEGGWTDNFEGAWSVTNLHEAAMAENRFKLKNCELYCFFDDKPTEPNSTILLRRRPELD